MNYEKLTVELLKSCPKRDIVREGEIFKNFTGAKLYLEMLRHIQQVDKKENEMKDLKFRKSIYDLTGYDPLKVNQIDVEEFYKDGE